MKIELGLHIVKRLKTLDEFSDLGRDELKENITELVEELLEQYANDNCPDDGIENQEEYE